MDEDEEFIDEFDNINARIPKDFNSENIQNFVKSFFKGELNESDEINDKKEKKVDL